jgi:hypothetical protein
MPRPPHPPRLNYSNNLYCALYVSAPIFLSASRNLLDHLNKIQQWLKKWRMKANENKSINVTFTMKRNNCPHVTLNQSQIPQAEDAKYLGIHIDKRLTWRKHISTKRKQLGIKFQKMYWMMGRQSELSTESKILLYKLCSNRYGHTGYHYGVQFFL